MFCWYNGGLYVFKIDWKIESIRDERGEWVFRIFYGFDGRWDRFIVSWEENLYLC